MLLSYLKKILFLILLISLLSNCNVNKYKQLINQEFNRYFSQDEMETYFNETEKKLLANSNDQEYLRSLYEILLNKRQKTSKRSLKYINNSEYDIASIQIKLIDFFHKNDENQIWIIKIFKEINYQSDFGYCNLMLSGMYMNYYNLITVNTNIMSKSLLNEFILSTPNINLALLAAYKFMIIYKIKIDYKLFWETYSLINKNNYIQLLSKPELFPFLSTEKRMDYKKNAEYYFKLRELIN